MENNTVKAVTSATEIFLNEINSTGTIDKFQTAHQSGVSPAQMLAYLASLKMAFKFGMGLHAYLLPIIVVIGFIGNTLSLRVMLMGNNRRISTCVYMSAVAIADNCMLMLAGYYWIGSILMTPIRRIDGEWECKIPASLFQLLSLFGVVLIMAMTFDRFIAVKYPFRAAEWCTPTRAKRTILGVLVVCTVYCIPFLFTAGLINDATCASVTGTDTLSVVYSWAGICLGSIVPFVWLMIMNGFIITTIKNKDESLQRSKSQGNLSNGEDGDAKSTSDGSTKQKQLTAMLLLVTFTLLLLTLPQYIRYAVFSFVPFNTSPDTYATYILVYNITNKLYFSNNAVNFFLYCIGGSKFRQNLREIFSCSGKK